MASSHALREAINEIVSMRPVRDGMVHGLGVTAEPLVSKGHTNAETTLSANYRFGDMAAFHRFDKRLGVEEGDGLRVAGVDREARTLMLQGTDRKSVVWASRCPVAHSGGVQVYCRVNPGLFKKGGVGGDLRGGTAGIESILPAASCIQPIDLATFLFACPARIPDFLLAVLAVPSGFRSSFNDWARQHDVDEVLSEFALAHVEGSATVAAYARDDLLERRRPVMQRWGDGIGP